VSRPPDPAASRGPLIATTKVGRRRVAADISAQIVGQALTLAFRVTATLLIARALGDRGFGQWSTILAVGQIATYASDLRLEQVAVRHAAADRGREPAWLGALISLRTALAFPASIICAGVLAVLATNAEMRGAGLLVAATVLFGGPSAVVAAFQLRVRNDLNVAITTATSLLWLAIVLVIVSTDGGLVPLALGWVAVAFAATALALGVALRTTPVRLRGPDELWRELLRVGVPLGIAYLLTLTYGWVDQVIVFALAGDRDAGLYGAVYRVLTQAALVPMAIMTTLLPIIAAAWSAERGRAHSLVQIASDYLALASLPLLALSLVLADPLVTLLFGREFGDAAPALPILTAALIPLSFGYLASSMVVVLGLEKKLIRYAAVGLVTNVALNLVLVPPYGFIAAAWATLVTELLVVALTLRAVLQTMEFLPRLGVMLRIAAAAAGMGGAIWLLLAAGAPLGALVGAAAVIYPALLFLLRVVRPRQVPAILRGRTT
jgi:O-antigen/teichoic acid export membrane protein